MKRLLRKSFVVFAAAVVSSLLLLPAARADWFYKDCDQFIESTQKIFSSSDTEPTRGCVTGSSSYTSLVMMPLLIETEGASKCVYPTPYPISENAFLKEAEKSIWDYLQKTGDCRFVTKEECGGMGFGDIQGYMQYGKCSRFEAWKNVCKVFHDDKPCSDLPCDQKAQCLRKHLGLPPVTYLLAPRPALGSKLDFAPKTDGIILPKGSAWGRVQFLSKRQFLFNKSVTKNSSPQATVLAAPALRDVELNPNFQPKLFGPKVETCVSTIITTVAGDGKEGFSGDGGAATEASLYHPSGVAFDGAGNLYISDTGNHRIRKVDASTGVITTMAGNGKEGFSGDGGAATEASLNRPNGIAVDGAGSLYIGDQYNNRIRKVDATSQKIRTLAGNGDKEFSGDGGWAWEASLYWPMGLAVDGAGNLYIADAGHARIRKVDATSQMISTVAGNGERGLTPDVMVATEAALHTPEGVAFDSVGNLYIADPGNHLIFKVDAASQNISPVDGIGKAGIEGRVYAPMSVALDGKGSLYFSDAALNWVNKVDEATHKISAAAGTGGKGFFSGDGGTATAARLNTPVGVAFDSAGNLYIADQFNNRVRKVSPCVTFTPSGNPLPPVFQSPELFKSDKPDYEPTPLPAPPSNQ